MLTQARLRSANIGKVFPTTNSGENFIQSI